MPGVLHSVFAPSQLAATAEDRVAVWHISRPRAPAHNPPVALQKWLTQQSLCVVPYSKWLTLHCVDRER